MSYSNVLTPEQSVISGKFAHKLGKENYDLLKKCLPTGLVFDPMDVNLDIVDEFLAEENITLTCNTSSMFMGGMLDRNPDVCVGPNGKMIIIEVPGRPAIYDLYQLTDSILKDVSAFDEKLIEYIDTVVKDLPAWMPLGLSDDGAFNSLHMFRSIMFHVENMMQSKSEDPLTAELETNIAHSYQDLCNAVTEGTGGRDLMGIFPFILIALDKYSFTEDENGDISGAQKVVATPAEIGDAMTGADLVILRDYMTPLEIQRKADREAGEKKLTDDLTEGLVDSVAAAVELHEPGALMEDLNNQNQVLDMDVLVRPRENLEDPVKPDDEARTAPGFTIH